MYPKTGDGVAKCIGQEGLLERGGTGSLAHDGSAQASLRQGRFLRHSLAATLSALSASRSLWRSMSSTAAL